MGAGGGVISRARGASSSSAPPAPTHRRLRRIWSLVSANYLHSGIIHLLFNLMALRRSPPGLGRIRQQPHLRHLHGRRVAATSSPTLPGCSSPSAPPPRSAPSSAPCSTTAGAVAGLRRAIYRSVGAGDQPLHLRPDLPRINNWGHGGGIAGGYLLGCSWATRTSPGEPVPPHPGGGLRRGDHCRPDPGALSAFVG